MLYLLCLHVYACERSRRPTSPDESKRACVSARSLVGALHRASAPSKRRMNFLKSAARSLTGTGRVGAAVGGAKQRYQAVDVEGADGVFTIEDDDGEDLNIEKLSRMHNMLLNQAQNTISSTESQVMSLREERRGHEAAMRELGVVNDAALSAMDSLGGAKTKRTPCCKVSSCVIL